jgi:hypothetical protein
MDDIRVNWWMDDTSRWHRGFPPTGWWQAEDGRWHPPDHDDEPTQQVWEVPPDGGAHLADGWGWPRWARVAVLASVAIVAVVVVAAAAITDGGGGNDQATVTAETTTSVTPSTSAASSASTAAPPGSAPSEATTSNPPAPNTTARAAPTTTAPPPRSTAPTTTSPPPTSPPPTNAGIRQGVPCSPEGATAISQDGVPMTCTTQKCHGAPYDSARWRRTAC